ncbi:MAG: CrcB family protein [Halobacteriaceae archaeon]
MTPLDPGHVVGTGGALGALSRFGLNQLVDGERYPVGTTLVNVLGSFLLGALTFAGVGGQFGLLLGTGFCGAFTTFSSFSYGTVRLWETGDRALAALNAASNLCGALAGVGLAWLLFAWA